YSHGNLHTEAISAPYAQSYLFACNCRLGDMPLTAARQIRLTLCGILIPPKEKEILEMDRIVRILNVITLEEL
ncbi:MAG: hypothetical protein KA146_12820, partial [Leptospiraceae bacterium]|nr:hypothetical protein [Leptospiraceae bacterium]